MNALPLTFLNQDIGALLPKLGLSDEAIAQGFGVCNAYRGDKLCSTCGGTLQQHFFKALNDEENRRREIRTNQTKTRNQT